MASDHFPELKQEGLIPLFGALISAKGLLLWFKTRWNKVTFDLGRNHGDVYQSLPSRTMLPNENNTSHMSSVKVSSSHAF